MQEFLARNKITAQTVHDARKEPLSPEDALAMLQNADSLYVARGKQTLRLELNQSKLQTEEIKKLLAGPTGKLRAPTFRVGRTIMVGFDEAACRELFGV